MKNLKYVNLFTEFTSLDRVCYQWHLRLHDRTYVQVEEKTLSHTAEIQFFSFRVVNLWNCLSSNVVSAPSVNAFKERLDKHLEGIVLHWIWKTFREDTGNK